MTVRSCACGCGAALVRREGERVKMFAARRTTGEHGCVGTYRAERQRAAVEARAEVKAASEAASTGWPAEMVRTRPFANNVRPPRFSPPRLPGPASLTGGCSSSSGWDVGE
jgi:hypothetical protein